MRKGAGMQVVFTWAKCSVKTCKNCGTIPDFSGIVRITGMMAASLFLVAACQDSASQGAQLHPAADWLHECSQAAFADMAADYAGQIGLAASRDQVVEVLKGLALKLHQTHEPDLRCDYEKTIQLPVKHRLIEVLPPSEFNAPQVMSARIASAEVVCVNYRDGTNDGEAGEFDDHDWSWQPGEGIMAGHQQRVFDPVCFSFP